MASRTRPRAHSETGTIQHDYGHLVSEAFQRYQLPNNLGQDIVGWPEEGVTRRIQSRFLGLSSLKLTHCTLPPPNMAFYEITESEISVIASRQRQPDLGEEDDKVSLSTTSASSPECVDALLSLAQSSPPPPLGDAMILTDNPTSSSSTRSLPPKKRKRRRVISYNVVFCIPSTMDEDLLTVPNPDQDYFLFPRDAVVEAVNQSSTPLEVMFSYHLPQCTIESTSSLIHASSLLHSMCSCRSSTYPSKLEEFATVCSDHLASTTNNNHNTFLRSQRRFTDPCIQSETCHVLNMRMTGVSKDLYDAMKQVVSNFESVCQRMMDLIRLHTERMNNEKAIDMKQEDQDMTEEEATITTMLTKTQVQSEEEEEVDPMLYDSTAAVATGGGHWSSDEWDKDLDDDQDDTDYCMTSPHSKSTIASTSSHYTAPPPPSVNTTVTTNSTTTTTTSNTETKKGGKSGNGSNGMKKCLYCGSKSTPMWRRGPQGAGTLCNACGVKWKHGKILCGNDAPSQTTLSSSTSTPAKESHPRRNSAKGDKRRRKTSSATIKKDKSRNKAAQQRKRASIQHKMESDEDDMMTGVQYTFTSPRDIVPESFHPRYQQQQQRMWEHSSSVSSYSHSFEESSCSPPLESFSSSPNSSIHDPMLDKNSSSSSSSSFPLSDAVEAATVLTLLKRS